MHAIARLRGSAPGDNSSTGEVVGGGETNSSDGNIRRGGIRGGEEGARFKITLIGSVARSSLRNGGSDGGARSIDVICCAEGDTNLDRSNGSGSGGTECAST